MSSGAGLAGARAWLAALLLALVLAACKPQPPQAARPPNEGGVAASLHPNALMDATFGSGQQQVDAQNVRWRARLLLPSLEPARLPGVVAAAASAGSQPAPAETTALRASQPLLPAAQRTEVLVTPREVVRLNDGRAVLVFESTPVDADGSPNDDPTRKVWLGAVFFQRQADAGDSRRVAKPESEQWQVSEFEPYVDAIGYEGSAGDSEVYKLSPDHFLLTFTPSHCANGVCATQLSGYLLQPQGMVRALQLPLSGSNRAAWPDCAPRLDGRRVPVAARAASGQVAAHACYAITGELHLLSREIGSADVTVRYRGWLAPADGPRRALQQTQRFQLANGRYGLVDGGPNPLPAD